MFSVVVMAKSPEQGKVKTRLAKHCGQEQATAIYCQLLHKALSNACGAVEKLGRNSNVELHYDGPRDHPFFVELENEFPLSFVPQSSGDLGQRMRHAIQHCLANGKTAVVIGADCPALSAQIISDAAEQLTTKSPYAFVTAQDGGYVLLASSFDHPAPFENIDWSTPQVMAQTEKQLQKAGLGFTCLGPLSDIDHWADYLSQKHLL